MSDVLLRRRSKTISRVGIPEGVSTTQDSSGGAINMFVEFFSGGQNGILTLPSGARFARFFVLASDNNGSNTATMEIGIYDVSGLAIPGDLEQAALLWSDTVELPNNSTRQYLQFDFNVSFAAHAGKDVAIAIGKNSLESYSLGRTDGSFYANHPDPSSAGYSLQDPFSVGEVTTTNVFAFYGEFES